MSVIICMNLGGRKEENVRYTLKEDDVVNLVDFYLFATHSALNFVKFASYTATQRRVELSR